MDEISMPFSTIFKGYQVDVCGRIVNTIKPNLDCEHINCPETSGHFTNIVTIRKNNVEVTYYEDQERYGSEIYFFKPGTYNIKYSRCYKSLQGLPKKYEETVNKLIKKHHKLFTK